MKISEMNNDQATEAMIRISNALGFICEDDEMMGLVDELQNMGNTPLIQAIPKILPRFSILAFRKHREQLYEIVGALACVPTKAVGKMNFKETIDLFKDSYDDILRDFFTTSGRFQKKNEEV